MTTFTVRFTQPWVSSTKRPLNSLQVDQVKVPVERLYCTKDQLSDIKALYVSEDVTTKILYKLEQDELGSHLPSQLEARTFLAEHGISLGDVINRGSRWNIVWKSGWGSGSLKRTRVLYQCACGYSTQARQDSEVAKARKKARKSGKSNDAPSTLQMPNTTVNESSLLTSESPPPWTRHSPYDFTGCLAHAEVTFCPEDWQILRVMGHLVHNEGCQQARMVRRPAIPLHPHVYHVALQQLRNGSDLGSVKAENRRLVEQKFYKGIREDPEFRKFRYLILRSDSSRVYRKLARLQSNDTPQASETLRT